MPPKKYFSTLLFYFIVGVFILYPLYFFGQNKDASTLEQKIFNLNNELKYEESEKILLEIINSDEDDTQKFKAYILLSNTYKRVFDYNSTFKYLNEASRYSSSASDKNTILGLKAMSYFDILKYDESRKILSSLQKQNFYGIKPEDKSILLMQIGYIHFLNKQYKEAENNYLNSLSIMTSIKSCHHSIVYGKMLLLYYETRKLNKIDSLYNVGIKSAEECNILKYKIYLTEQYLQTINRQDYEKTLKYKAILDTLNYNYKTNDKLASLHEVKNKFTDDELEKVETKSFFYKFSTVILIFLSILLLYFLVNFYKKRKKSEEEYIEIKKTFDFYANNLTISEEITLEEILHKDVFSQRQKEILDLVLHGYNNLQIAEKLFISENTVKFHIKNIYKILSENNIKFERYKTKMTIEENEQ